MPIQIGDRTFISFKAAVKHIMKVKRWTKEKASAYVASIERKQQPS